MYDNLLVLLKSDLLSVGTQFYSGLNGVLESEGYPAGYPDNTDSTMVIEVPNGYRVYIQVCVTQTRSYRYPAGFPDNTEVPKMKPL